jgi:hypothetical protein
MEITVQERLSLLDILPGEGNIITLRVVRELKSALAFTEPEIKEYGLTVTESGRVSLNIESLGVIKSITVGDAAAGIIKSALRQLDKQGKLKDDHIRLWDKFIGD